MTRGFSLIETLVVVALFAVIAAVVAQATAVSLTGSRKADAAGKVRENISYAVNVVERQLRSARRVSSACSPSGETGQTVLFTNEDGASATVGCTTGPSSYVYFSPPAPATTMVLTNRQTVSITNCTFVCTEGSGNLPPKIDITIEGTSRETEGAEAGIVQVQTSVNLRAY